MNKNFYYKDKHLFCEDIELQKFSEQRETPYYLYSQSEIESNCKQITEAGKDFDFLPCYALKANYNPHLLNIIREQGFGADVVSGGELLFALKTGFPPKKIVFAGVGKTAQEIEFAIKTGIHSLNIESAEEMQMTAEIAEQLQKKVRIALRVNPDIEAKTHKFISTGQHINKFGIPVDEAFDLYLQANENKWLQLEGIHIHIGSQIVTAEPFLKAVDFLKSFADKLKNAGVPISYLDLGGGVGVDYHNNFMSSTLKKDYLKEILSAYIGGFKDSGYKLVAELGRSVIGSAGILVSQVILRKQTPLKKFVVVDAAMNNLIRPSLYSAHHEIVPLVQNEQEFETFDVVGPICESTDFLAKDRNLQPLKSGDYMAVTTSGAYGQALGSNYNLRPMVKEYLVSGSKVDTIYEGRSIDSLFEEYGF